MWNATKTEHHWYVGDSKESERLQQHPHGETSDQVIAYPKAWLTNQLASKPTILTLLPPVDAAPC